MEELNKIQIFNEDYKKTIRKLIKDEIQVDAIITDPPYNVSRNHQLGFSNMGRSGMDFGEWDYNFNQTKWIKLSSELLKPGGSIIIFNDWKNMGKIAEELEKNDIEVKDIIRWTKRNPMPRNVKRRYVNDCEYAIWGVKNGAKWTFNKPEDVPYLRPEINTSVVSGGKKRIHPTQKHLDLMKELIEIHTNENDVVFDPFLGSGTTAVACIELNRFIIGSEIDPKYYDAMMERLKK